MKLSVILCWLIGHKYGSFIKRTDESDPLVLAFIGNHYKECERCGDRAGWNLPGLSIKKEENHED